MPINFCSRLFPVIKAVQSHKKDEHSKVGLVLHLLFFSENNVDAVRLLRERNVY